MFLQLLLFFALNTISYQFLNKLRNIPPSPYPALPKISNQHGPILRFHFGSRPVVVVSSPSAVEECQSKNDVVWANPPLLLAGRHYGPVTPASHDGLKLMPFGFGSRSGPGEVLALRMVGLALGSLLLCFDWENVSQDKVDVAVASGLTLPKAHPLQAKI